MRAVHADTGARVIRQKFFIDAILPGANDVLRVHPRVYSRMKIEQDLIVRCCIRRARMKRMEWARVGFVWHEKPNSNGQSRDPDNVRFGSKFVMDALVKENILEDDSRFFVVGMADDFEWESKTPGVWVHLEGEWIKSKG